MRYLTKSRFKLGMECPAKLFYTHKKDEYADWKFDDPFLAELASGGFQVGELAKYYYPGGIEVGGLGYEETVAETNELLKRENVTIFEAAIRHEKLFMRVDVLRKRGNHFDLIEVKSKSFDGLGTDEFLTSKYRKQRDGSLKEQRRFIVSDWQSYLYDVAFQKYVLEQAFPEMSVTGYLMLSDKSATCPTDGLNQKFRVKKGSNGRTHVVVAGEVNEEDLSEPILTAVDVDRICEMIFRGEHVKDPGDMSFAEIIDFFSERYAADERIWAPLGSHCGGCEFRATAEDEEKGLKSGFKECWKKQLGWRDEKFALPTVLDVWDFRGKDKLLADGRGCITDIKEIDLNLKEDDKPGLSRTERQLMQVTKSCEADDSCWIEVDCLKREMASWKFPLHFIDFETSQTAVPFNKGHRPYEPIAFQFSHHTVDESGEVSHVGEFLLAEPGVFPNFEFLRALKGQLEGDQGTIFRYAAHENTYLNHIYKQLSASAEPDREELEAFLKSITKSSGSMAEKWEGERNMVDMLYLVKRFYYDPSMGGTNSIKKVLPAIMRSSEYVREKYSEPVYGSVSGIRSLNFVDKVWVEFEGGDVKDPYSLLGKMFEDVSDHDFELLSEEDEVKEGGAAMAAYAKLQFEDISDYERGEIEKALLRYCELDTLAMVMIYEGWREMIG